MVGQRGFQIQGSVLLCSFAWTALLLWCWLVRVSAAGRGLRQAEGAGRDAGHQEVWCSEEPGVRLRMPSGETRMQLEEVCAIGAGTFQKVCSARGKLTRDRQFST